MGDVIDFAKNQKSRRKKKTTSFPSIFKDLGIHAIRLLASIIKSGTYYIAYIVKAITGMLIRFFAILTIVVLVVEYISNDIGYKSIYNAALLLSIFTVLHLLASVYLKRQVRIKK